MKKTQRTIKKKVYAENRAEGNAAAAKVRKAIKDATGKPCPAKVEIDHIKPIAKGGHPTHPDNLQVTTKKTNRAKGAKTVKGT
jgi:5-methylcytosine-specific restriction endonuclease McrA